MNAQAQVVGEAEGIKEEFTKQRTRIALLESQLEEAERTTAVLENSLASANSAHAHEKQENLRLHKAHSLSQTALESMKALEEENEALVEALKEEKDRRAKSVTKIAELEATLTTLESSGGLQDTSEHKKATFLQRPRANSGSPSVVLDFHSFSSAFQAAVAGFAQMPQAEFGQLLDESQSLLHGVREDGLGTMSKHLDMGGFEPATYYDRNSPFYVLLAALSVQLQSRTQRALNKAQEEAAADHQEAQVLAC